jgi:hypothetical protein
MDSKVGALHHAAENVRSTKEHGMTSGPELRFEDLLAHHPFVRALAASSCERKRTPMTSLSRRC